MKFAPLLSLAMMLAGAPAAAQTFTLTSPDVSPAGPIGERHVLNGFGCNGGNVSPSLVWSGAPAGTESFAITVYDPDAPTGSGWWHWIVFDIPVGTTSLPAGAGRPDGSGLPHAAVQSRTDFGTPGYGGPCPPPGRSHRYVFTVHALKTDKLGVSPDASGAMAGFNLGAQTIATASFTATYRRAP